MGQILYERPRERLIDVGASALTTAELIQLVLGSGTVGVPVAKIARQVARQASGVGGLTYESLRAITGIGTAKACQLVAAVELGARIARAENSPAARRDTSFAEHFTQLRTLKRQHSTVILFDGNDEPTQTFLYGHAKAEHYTVRVRRIMTAVVAGKAASFCVGIGYKVQPIDPTMADLAFARAIAEAAKSLQLPPPGIALVSATYTQVITPGKLFSVSSAVVGVDI